MLEQNKNVEKNARADPMDITAAIPEGQPQIDAYGNGGFRISRHRYEGSVCIQPSGVSLWNGRFDEVIFDDDTEILLFGFGHNRQHLPNTFIKTIIDRNIGHDIMDTGAACRTYNVLASEGRRVAALLCHV